MPKRTNGRTAIVTGAAQGIGRAIATRLAADGAAVAIADINQAAAEQAANELRDAGARVTAIVMDVGDTVSIAAATSATQRLLGPPTILINNAGLFPQVAALKMSAAQWQSTLAVNLSGAFLVSLAVLPCMTAAKWGRIVNMSSMMAVTAFGEDAAYCSTKAGLLGLTRSLAAEFGPYNICVNAICPGNIASKLMWRRWQQAWSSAMVSSKGHFSVTALRRYRSAVLGCRRTSPKSSPFCAARMLTTSLVRRCMSTAVCTMAELAAKGGHL